MKHIVYATLALALMASAANADYRSAKSGKYVTSDYGTSHPSTTVKEGR